MAIVEATLCLPFKQAAQAFAEWQQKVLEACERTGFPNQHEAAEVLSEMEGIMVPLLYAQLIESITVDFGLAEVHFFLRYDAQPDDEDELELALLDLVLDQQFPLIALEPLPLMSIT